MIQSVVAQYQNVAANWLPDDLRQEASLGLLKAAERFDPRHGVVFGTYAKRFVRGRILHYIRKVGTNLIHEPAWLKEARYQVERDGGEGLTPFARDRVSRTESLFGEMAPLPHSLPTKDSSTGSAECWTKQADLRVLLDAVMRPLTDEERRVLLLYYVEGHTMAEIAETLGYCEYHIFKLRCGGLEKVRALIEELHLTRQELLAA